MFNRMLKLPADRSFFLLGARNTGKSTLIEQNFPVQHTVYYDLLDPDVESEFARDPNHLYRSVQALPAHITHVVIDEVQKVPKLLDVVQRLMKAKDRVFILSGSSARKLKRGGANLLAGRAFMYHLFPLTFIELADDFNLDHALQWGSLPEVMLYADPDEKRQFLTAYGHSYLKEEIAVEQLVRKLDPFRKFLEVAAQSNGKVINYAKIARDVGVNDNTIKSYFSMLEDTLVGYHLEAFHYSVRKQLSQKPKFYFFDTGVVRVLARLLTVDLLPQTHAYGNAFEHFIINECMRLNAYLGRDFRFSYLRTKSDMEIDLVVERPGKKLCLIEIKSTTELTENKLKNFIKLSADFDGAESICLSQDPLAKQFQHVLALPWQAGLKQLFGLGEAAA